MPYIVCALPAVALARGDLGPSQVLLMASQQRTHAYVPFSYSATQRRGFSYRDVEERPSEASVGYVEKRLLHKLLFRWDLRVPVFQSSTQPSKCSITLNIRQLRIWR